MTRDAGYERLATGPLSLYDLADLLGIHPHQLRTGQHRDSLIGQPIRVLIELCRHFDLHPADLVAELEPLLRIDRDTDAPPVTDDGDNGRDARTLLSALATASDPLSLTALAQALEWPLDRADAALDHAYAHPELAGPLALRRTPTNAYTLTPRLDLLTKHQRDALAHCDQDAFTFTAPHAEILLATLTLNHTMPYLDWITRNRREHTELVEMGVLHPAYGSTTAEVHPDVLYSLRLTGNQPHRTDENPIQTSAEDAGSTE